MACFGFEVRGPPLTSGPRRGFYARWCSRRLRSCCVPVCCGNAASQAQASAPWSKAGPAGPAAPAVLVLVFRGGADRTSTRYSLGSQTHRRIGATRLRPRASTRGVFGCQIETRPLRPTTPAPTPVPQVVVPKTRYVAARTRSPASGPRRNWLPEEWGPRCWEAGGAADLKPELGGVLPSPAPFLAGYSPRGGASRTGTLPHPRATAASALRAVLMA